MTCRTLYNLSLVDADEVESDYAMEDAILCTPSSSRFSVFAVLLAALVGSAVLLVTRRLRKTDSASSWSGCVPRRLLGIGLVAVGLVLAILSFRIAYFGVLSPQPTGVKFRGVGRHALEQGLRYAFETLQSDYFDRHSADVCRSSCRDIPTPVVSTL